MTANHLDHSGNDGQSLEENHTRKEPAWVSEGVDVRRVSRPTHSLCSAVTERRQRLPTPTIVDKSEEISIACFGNVQH